jgi:DNA (cytosine-5)-methyltransferase 1
MIYVSQDVWKFGEGVSRRLSWIEAARIQTFPAFMQFSGDLTSKYKQIGNAVPVKLAEVVAKQLLKTLGESYE